jgi:N-hydroxyarylamine O-acetyltransferase
VGFVQVDAYLKRIGYEGSRQPTVGTLRRLHRAHLLTVPFENLDVLLGRPIHLSLPALYDKIVLRRRGGFCYELNGLFAWLLEELGFPVERLSAGVFNGPKPGPEFDHLFLLVELVQPYMVDVGFGDSFLEPLRLDSGEEEVQRGSAYRLLRSGPNRVLERLQEADWEPQYAFSLAPRRLDEFSAMCNYHQTSPESHFTQRATCSMATPEGRITLSNSRLIVTKDGRRDEMTLAGERQYRRLLHRHFGIDLGEGVGVDQLMAPGIRAS